MPYSNPVRILLMEDDRGLARLFQKRLERSGYVVDLAYDDEEGLAMYDRNAYDIMVLDQIMPIHTGLDVIRILASRGPLPPLIMLTGSGSEGIAVEAMKLGALDYIIKDVDGRYLDLLPSVIEHALHQHRLAEEKKRADHALRRSEQRFREMAELLPSIICETDMELRLIYINKLGLETFGFNQDEFHEGIKVMTFIHPDDKERAAKHMKRITNGVSIGIQEYRMLRKDGSQIAVLVNAAPVYEDGRITGMRATVTNITDQKELHEELFKAQKLEAIGVLAGGIAHDFNNMLTTVLGNISLARIILDTGDKQKVAKLLAEAEKSALQSKDLTSRLITFSKGGEPLKKEVAIGEFVKKWVNSTLSVSSIHSEFSITDDLWPVEVDERQIKQIIHNVIINSVESMSACAEDMPGRTGKVLVYCENTDIAEHDGLTLKPGKYVKICLKDQGAGISEENLPKVFDPYFSTKDRGSDKGMGLGLAVCHSILKKHGGLITVDSEVGVGTTVNIYLPSARNLKTKEAQL